MSSFSKIKVQFGALPIPPDQMILSTGDEEASVWGYKQLWRD
jgi:hypothetical protein